MKRVGIVSFFPAFQPPKSGGELRLSAIAHRLAEDFTVELVAPTYGEAAEEVIRHAPGFTEWRFPKKTPYNRWHAFLDRMAGFSECSGLVCSLACRAHGELVREVDRLNRVCDVISHESPFLAPLLPRRRRPGQTVVYNSYNVEAVLARDMFGRGPWGRWATARVRALEARLCREADVILACSQDDAEGMVREYGICGSKVLLVPNGVDVDSVRPPADAAVRHAARVRLAQAAGVAAQGQGAPAMVFFIGSFHPPNIEAVEFLVDRVAPRVPESVFLIAGKVCAALAGRALPSNVRALGLVSDETRNDLLHGCDAALNPMFSGSGTNLKMLEYLAAGLPIVSTAFGARGLDLEHDLHLVLADRDDFIAVLRRVLSDHALAARLGREARRHAEARFSWRVITDRVAHLYAVRTSPRVLVLNDYAITPAQAGGQIRVDAVARDLAASGRAVTILTLQNDGIGRRRIVAPGVEEVNVPKTPLQRRIDGLVSHFARCSADDVSALLFSRWLTPGFARALRRELTGAAAALFSHCYLAQYLGTVRRRAPVFYDAHNVEWHLKRELFADNAFSRLLVGRVRAAESRLAREARGVFCVSDATREALIAMVGPRGGDPSRMVVVPNGVDCSRLVPAGDDRRRLRRESVGLGPEPTAIFLGSGHPPNADAARVIIERVAPENPSATFLFVGSVCGWFYGQATPPNCVMVGAVAAPVKDFLLESSDIALNPMLSGSGTSLKLFDYLAAGLPVLTTPIGARGIDPEDLGALILAEVPEFARAASEALADPAALSGRREAARRLAETKFDWRVALRPMREALTR